MEILSEKVTKRIPFLKEIRIGDPLQGYPRSGSSTIFPKDDVVAVITGVLNDFLF